MKRIGRLVILAMMTAALLVPGFGGTASAQDANWCTEAAGMTAGSDLYGYTVVYGSGGAGSQIVLSDGSGYLSGGSGNDVLCAWGGGNTLDGGSGNDVLIVMRGAGNMLLGGSGNDTLIGYAEDMFDGGSGRNETLTSAIPFELWIEGDVDTGVVEIKATGFPAFVMVELHIALFSSSNATVDTRLFYTSVAIDIDQSGSFSYPYDFCETRPDAVFSVLSARNISNDMLLEISTPLSCP